MRRELSIASHHRPKRKASVLGPLLVAFGSGAAVQENDRDGRAP
jgi:hypothetical protein